MRGREGGREGKKKRFGKTKIGREEGEEEQRGRFINMIEKGRSLHTRDKCTHSFSQTMVYKHLCTVEVVLFLENLISHLNCLLILTIVNSICKNAAARERKRG